MFTQCALEVALYKSLKKRIIIYAQSLLFYAITRNISFASKQRNSIVDACKCIGTSNALP
jgi:hypothetical protein